MSSDKITLFYCDDYDFPLPPGHKFPLAKYGLLRTTLSADPRMRLNRSAPIAIEDVLRVHDSAYVEGFVQGTLGPQALRRIGLPWSPEFVQRTLASAGATLSATQQALQHRVAGTLAGGTHHAYRDAGSGYCVFNDIAIAIEWARVHCGVTRAAVVDLDVHQGDGTASIFHNDPGVFTLSLHGLRNFPFRKQHSTLDVALEDGTNDTEYLAALEPALSAVWAFAPELVLYQSGVDGLKEDRLGRLALTQDGLGQRDKVVIHAAQSRNLPLVITLGGGYAEPITYTAAAHAQTFRIAADTYISASHTTAYNEP